MTDLDPWMLGSAPSRCELAMCLLAGLVCICILFLLHDTLFSTLFHTIDAFDHHTSGPNTMFVRLASRLTTGRCGRRRKDDCFALIVRSGFSGSILVGV